MTSDPSEPAPVQRNHSTRRLAIAALGIVFGDIGTSPLYAFRESFVGHHPLPVDELHVMGVLSLIVWALILVVTVKYVLITMRADNRGEGGSFALLALIQRVVPTSRALPFVSVAALVATALFYGDAVITPAISILSAVEGLSLADPRLSIAILPVTLVITVALFAIQWRGTAEVGRWFGPVMLVWFITIGVLGLANIVDRPSVLGAINPAWAVGLVVADPLRAFLTMGTVVLTITGAEALYADMGHFGRRPISRAWLAIALPALLFCYAGQSALVLQQPQAIDQAFYRLAPGSALWPLLALATAATVIASQAFISAAFSVTAQAIQLGYLPRVTIRHTSAEERGQIFAPGINVMLCVAVVAVILTFRSSTALAAAFGFAVTATMLLTTLVIGFVIFRIWRWNPLWAVPVYAMLLFFDLALFGAASTKILDGAWLPLLIATLATVTFLTWARGRKALTTRLADEALSVDTFLRSTAAVPRVSGLAVYFTRDSHGVPTALLHSLKHHHVVHERVLLLTITTSLLPQVAASQRLCFTELAPGLGRAVLTFGFMDEPDVPSALAALPTGWHTSPMKTSFVLGRQVLVPTAKPGFPHLQDSFFAAMVRLAGSAADYYRLPPGRVIELGSQIQL